MRIYIPLYLLGPVQIFALGYLYQNCSPLVRIVNSTLPLDVARYVTFFLWRPFLISPFLLQDNVCSAKSKSHGFIVTGREPLETLLATSTHWSVLIFISRFSLPAQTQIQCVSGENELQSLVVTLPSIKSSTVKHFPLLPFKTLKPVVETAINEGVN